MNRKSTVLVPGSLFPMEDVLIFKHSSFLRHQPKPPRVSLCSLSKCPSSSLVCCGDAPPLAFPLVSLLPKPSPHQKPKTPLISSPPPLLMVSDIILYDHACYGGVEAFLFHGTTAFFVETQKVSSRWSQIYPFPKLSLPLVFSHIYIYMRPVEPFLSKINL